MQDIQSLDVAIEDKHHLITPAKLRAWDIWWDDKQIMALFAGRDELTARVITNDESISRHDRVWVLASALAHKDIWLPYSFALWCAEQTRSQLSSEWKTRLTPIFKQVRAQYDRTAAAPIAKAVKAKAAKAKEAAEAAEAVFAAVAEAEDRDVAGADVARAAADALRAAAEAAWVAWVACIEGAEVAWAIVRSAVRAERAFWAVARTVGYDQTRAQALHMLES